MLGSILKVTTLSSVVTLVLGIDLKVTTLSSVVTLVLGYRP